MGERFDRLRYEVFQNLFLSPMNTGSVRPAVATTPTACGIETNHTTHLLKLALLQQHLPPAVLKLCDICKNIYVIVRLQQHLPPAVLKHSHTAGLCLLTIDCCNNTYRLRY